jgi:hypothetical protein
MGGTTIWKTGLQVFNLENVSKSFSQEPMHQKNSTSHESYLI